MLRLWALALISTVTLLEAPGASAPLDGVAVTQGWSAATDQLIEFVPALIRV